MRILFITASRIGDAVLSAGLLNHLAQTYPQARFTVACGAAAADLFRAAPFVERVIPMTKRRRAGHWRDLWCQTVGHVWSLVVDLRGSALAYLVPALRRRVLKSDWTPKHRLYHLSSVLGLDQAFPPVLWTGAAEQRMADQLLPPDRAYLALGPTANWGAKQWPADRFLDLAHQLTGPGGRLDGAGVVLFGAETERETVQALVAGLPQEKVIDLMGRISLGTAQACLAKASLYVGNDSGLMHMAAAAGCPTLGLFGPSSELFYGPVGPRTLAVRGPRSFEDICHAPDYDYRSQACMMLDLEVSKVMDACGRLLDQA